MGLCSSQPTHDQDSLGQAKAVQPNPVRGARPTPFAAQQGAVSPQHSELKQQPLGEGRNLRKSDSARSDGLFGSGSWDPATPPNMLSGPRSDAAGGLNSSGARQADVPGHVNGHSTHPSGAMARPASRLSGAAEPPLPPRSLFSGAGTASPPIAVSNCSDHGAASSGRQSQHAEGDSAPGSSVSDGDSKIDQFTSLAASIFKVPLVAVIMMQGRRMSIRNLQGGQLSEMPWLEWLLGWTELVECQERVVVPDLQQDARFSDHVLVKGPPNLRFFAASPVSDPAMGIQGTMCLLDFQPHAFDADAQDMLDSMAAMVVRETKSEASLEESRRQSCQLARANSSLLQAIESFHQPLMLVDVAAPGWPVLLVDRNFSTTTGISWSRDHYIRFWDVFMFAGTAGTKEERCLHESASQMQQFVAPVTTITSQGPARYCCAFQPVTPANCRDYLLLLGVADMQLEGHHFRSCYFVTLQDAIAPADPISPASQPVGEPRAATISDIWPDVELGPLIGQGSFGRVYQGMCQQRMVAIKVIEMLPAAKVDMSGTPLEAQLMMGLRHPNMVETLRFAVRQKPEAVASAFLADQETWLLLEFCDRGCIQDAIEQGMFSTDGRPDMRKIVTTALELASAMAYVHQRNIIHGDLTGNNVLLSSCDGDPRGCTVKIADFGLARSMKNQSRVETRTHGTVTHMPPELLNEGLLTKASDVYAVGVLLWELYCGKRAWEGMRHAQVIHAVAIQRKHPAFPEDAHPAFKALAERCMGANTKERPTFAEIMVQLRAMLGDS